MPNCRVEYHHWESGSGFSYSTNIDLIPEEITAEEWIKGSDSNGYDFSGMEEGKIVIVNCENDEVLSEAWIEDCL